ncbi:hypothetical protein BGW38_002240 [Lunasporangiospora selenospora]|uniref:LYC1 C-terminal domain-containing protein n=1 Tax=Lunasporangiospora selenospora TaxID=979761 RepID=A0A9P6FT42_9FUNG|nr:hypothetical protein BGW38_002240 [Lunasporangiospora selenospora]
MPHEQTKAEKRGTPPYQLEDLTFIPITTDEKLEQMWTENHQEWGARFSQEDWLQAAKERASLDFSAKGRYKTFMMTLKDDSSQPMIGSCGFYERPAIMATKKATISQDGKNSSVKTGVQDVLSATVCYVFVPERYRGHGYGVWMMSQLWQYLEKSRVQFTFLYSIVGQFYDRFGWKKHRSDCLEWMIEEAAVSLPAEGSCSAWESITDNNLHRILELDASLLREEMTSQIEDSQEETTLFAVLPEPRTFGWHRCRENFYLRQLKQDLPTQVERYGVFLPTHKASSGSFLGALCYITWYHEFRRDELIVTRFRYDADKDSHKAKQEALLLVQQAIEEARRWALKKIILWNPHPALCEWTGLQSQERPNGFSCLGACQESSLAVQDHAPTSHIEWVVNEYYPWC